MSDVPRRITGTMLAPDGQPITNRTLTWYRANRRTLAQGSSVIVDEVFRTATNALGEVDVSVVPGAYLVMVRLADQDRYFEVGVPEGTGPLLMQDLIDTAAPVLTPPLLIEAQDARDAAILAKGQAETARDKAQQWAESATAPGGPSTKSAKTWAGEAAASAGAAATAAAQLPKSTLDATRAPLPTDDETQGYAPGSRWLWQGQEWVLVDAAAGAAAWDEATRYDVASLPALLVARRNYPHGSIITTRAEGYSYQVVDTDHDLTTAGGVKLRVVGFPVYPEMFGARPNDPSFDCTPAIQAAMNRSRLVYFRDADYYCAGRLFLPTKQVLVGSQGPNGNSTSRAGGARIIFNGSGASCFYPQDTSTFISHGGIHGITVRVTGAYSWAFDMPWCQAWHWSDMDIQPMTTTCGGIRSLKDTSDGSSNWLNVLKNVHITLPTGSTARPLEHSWSDSRISNGALSGGIGSLDTGAGNIYAGPNIERSYGFGLTLKKKLTTTGTLISACFFDANAGGGIHFDMSEDVSTHVWHLTMHHTVVGCKFRSISPYDGSYAAADIRFTGRAGVVYRGGVIAANVFSLSNVPPYQIATGQWDEVVFNGNSDMSQSSAPTVLGTTDLTFFGPRGLSIPKGPSILRGYASILGGTGVAAHVGAPMATGLGSGVQLGSLSGAAPYIGASQNTDGVWSDLRVYTGGNERLRVSSDGAYIRPGADNAESLGTWTFRWSQIYAGAGTINTSDARAKTDIRDIEGAERRVAQRLKSLLRAYRMRDAVSEKGDAARVHFGIVAQEVAEAFDAEGLEPRDYALFCHNEWSEQPGILGDEGEVVEPHVPAGDRYGIRYDELLCFLMAAM